MLVNENEYVLLSLSVWKLPWEIYFHYVSVKLFSHKVIISMAQSYIKKVKGSPVKR
jgi:hypothetical protein